MWGRRASRRERKISWREEVQELIYVENMKVWLLSLLEYLNVLTSISPHIVKRVWVYMMRRVEGVLGAHANVSICGLASSLGEWKCCLSLTHYMASGRKSCSLLLVRVECERETLLSCYAGVNVSKNTFSIYYKVCWCTPCNLLLSHSTLSHTLFYGTFCWKLDGFNQNL